MDYNRLDRKIMISWRISRLIRLVVIGVILGLPTLILSTQDFFTSAAPYVYPIEALLLVYLVLSLLLYPAIEYRQWRYILTSDRVEIRHGIFFIETSIIPMVRIQHITVGHGPILRKLGLSNVIIHTASGAFAIAGLSNETAGTVAGALKERLYTRLEAQEKV